MLRKRQNERLKRSRGSGAGGTGVGGTGVGGTGAGGAGVGGTGPQSPAPAGGVPAWAAFVAENETGAALDGAAARGAAGTAGAAPVRREVLARLRKELNGLIGAWHHRTGQPHAVMHADLRRACGGPPLPQATAGQIQARIDTIRLWARSGR